MTTLVPGMRRPGRPVLVDAGVRTALVVAAAVALAAAARIRRPALPAATVLAGGAVVALVLTGLVLNLLPAGLSGAAWGVAVAVLELVVLAITAALPVRRHAPRIPLAVAVWGAAVTAVLAVTIAWCVASYGATHVRPLSLAATTDGDRVAVTISSGADAGPYELDLVTDRGRSVLARDVEVGPAGSRTVEATVPDGVRGLVQLRLAGATAPVRQLVVEGGGS